MTDSIGARIALVREHLTQAAPGREVELVAVSKGQPAAAIVEAYRAGQRVFGESRIQELKRKRQELLGLLSAEDLSAIQWHLVGRLQRNKAKDALELFDVIQSVDRLPLAMELGEKLGRLQAEGRLHKTQQRVFLQVNVSQEEQKGGVEMANVADLYRRLLDIEGIVVEGLMCIGSAVANPALSALTRQEFENMVRLRSELEKINPGYLSGSGRRLQISMGMSGDYQVAAQLGADLVRVGTGIFGPRGLAR